MSYSASPAWLTGGARRWGVALLILVVALLAILVPAAAQRPNGAGIVVRFVDGSVLYAYVQFEEDTISSEELLYRSGLSVTIAPYGGLGAGVCAINGEGCPSDNCFCESYTTPAYFWHYYAYEGGWREMLQGVSSRRVGDGDIDGFSWTAGESGLPPVTIDEIALLNGVDRNPPEPTPTDTPTLEPTSTPQPSPSTPSPPATLPPSTSTPTLTATSAPTNQPSATPAPTQSPMSSATASSSIGQVAASPTPTATVATATTIPLRPTPTLTLVASATTRAVIVQPDGTVVPVDVTTVDDGSSSTTLLLFGGLVLLATGAGGFVWLRSRRLA